MAHTITVRAPYAFRMVPLNVNSQESVLGLKRVRLNLKSAVPTPALTSCGNPVWLRWLSSYQLLSSDRRVLHERARQKTL